MEEMAENTGCAGPGGDAKQVCIVRFTVPKLWF